MGVTTFPETRVLAKCYSENISAIIAWPKNFADSETHGTGLQVAVHIDEFEDGSVGIASHSNLHQCLNEPNLTTSLQSVVSNSRLQKKELPVGKLWKSPLKPTQTQTFQSFSSQTIGFVRFLFRGTLYVLSFSLGRWYLIPGFLIDHPILSYPQAKEDKDIQPCQGASHRFLSKQG